MAHWPAPPVTLARRLSHLHSLAFALCAAAVLHQLRQERHIAQEQADWTCGQLVDVGVGRFVVKHAQVALALAVNIDQRTNRLIVASAIDNIVKGASGQAIQNMNLMCGYDEKSGLDAAPFFP